MEHEIAPEPSFVQACLHHPIFGDSVRRETYKASETIRAFGAPIREFGMVEDGYLKTVHYTVSGTEMCNGYFETDDVFPELLYFTGKKVYTYNLVAVKRSTIAWIDAKTFEVMMQEDRELAYRFMLYMSKRGLKNQMLLTCLRYQTIRERIANWLLWMDETSQDGRIPLPSQTIWANELRVSRSSLNQEIKRMEAQGLFRVRNHCLELLDRKGLEKLV